jgi:hypothetical protein
MRSRVWIVLSAASATACGALLGLTGDDDAPATPSPAAAEAAPPITPITPPADGTAGSADGGCAVFDSGARSAIVRRSLQAKTIDGDLSDYGSPTAFVIDSCNAAETMGTPRATAAVKLEWSADALYIGIDVTDANREGTDASLPYLNDGVEIYVTPNADRNGCYGATDRHFIIDHTGVASRYQSQDLDAAAEPIAADRVEVVQTAGGYRIELAIDATIFGAPLVQGQTLYFDVLVNDNNGEAQVNWRTWAMHPFDAGGVCGCSYCGISPAFDTRWLSPIVLE